MTIIKNYLFKLSRASGAIKNEILVKNYAYCFIFSSRRFFTDQEQLFFILSLFFAHLQGASWAENRRRRIPNRRHRSQKPTTDRRKPKTRKTPREAQPSPRPLSPREAPREAQGRPPLKRRFAPKKALRAGPFRPQGRPF